MSFLVSDPGYNVAFLYRKGDGGREPISTFVKYPQGCFLLDLFTETVQGGTAWLLLIRSQAQTPSTCLYGGAYFHNEMFQLQEYILRLIFSSPTTPLFFLAKRSEFQVGWRAEGKLADSTALTIPWQSSGFVTTSVL